MARAHSTPFCRLKEENMASSCRKNPIVSVLESGFAFRWISEHLCALNDAHIVCKISLQRWTAFCISQFISLRSPNQSITMPINQNKVVPYIMVVPIPVPHPSPPPPPSVSSFIDDSDHRRRQNGGGASAPPCTCLSSVLGGLLLFTLLAVAVAVPTVVLLSHSQTTISTTTTTSTTTSTSTSTSTSSRSFLFRPIYPSEQVIGWHTPRCVFITLLFIGR